VTGRWKVLLVDDDDDIRTIGELALVEVGGMEVVLASSGPQALELAAREQPHVVLLDVMMPGMDGLTTFRRLRDDPATAAIPVVFVTAKVQRHEVQRYLDLGGLGVIGKPFDPMSLPDELRAILARAPQRPATPEDDEP
jgi:two-component system, OmpR family, response regulator